MEWITLYLVRFPHVQEKIFEEVASLTAENSRRISLGDKPEAHYFQAFLEELARHCPMGFIAPPHKTLNDTVIQGKKIPKDTQVF